MIIYNPNAGKYATGSVPHQAGEILSEMGWQVEVVPSNSGAHITELAQEAAQANYSAVILSGGDGSIGNAVNGLAGSETALGVIPTGTANVWAKELGLPKLSPRNQDATLREICQALTDSVPQKVDVGICNGRHFLLWTGIGLDAMVVQESESKRARWKKKFVELEYGYLILKYIFSWPGLQLKITVDGGDHAIDGRYLMGIITNIRRYAGGHMTISPNAAMDDGKMDLWLFPAKNWRKSLKYIAQVVRGRHEQNDEIQRIGFKELSITAKKDTDLHVDGDPLDKRKKIEITVEQKALAILVPPGAPIQLTQV
jgi:YegS/Rv2252/BmrU family lipid kinase